MNLFKNNKSYLKKKKSSEGDFICPEDSHKTILTKCREKIKGDL